MQLASVSAGGKGHREETADGDKNDVVFDASDAGRGKILNNLIIKQNNFQKNVTI